MRIVIGNHNLAGPGGTETYTLTVAAHLERLGHEVWVHADHQGALADQARSQGIRVPEVPARLPAEVDAVLAHDAMTMTALAARYPLAPMVMVGHSDIFDMSLPPRLPELLAGVVVLYDRVDRRIRGMDLGVPITRLQQPVDVQVFQSLRPLPERARVALVMGNYVHGDRLGLIERACERAGLECRHVGGHADRRQTLTPAQTLNEGDIVIGKARVVIEAMATGRAAYVLDHNGGDGWVTAESYEALAADNFGGQSTPLIVSEDRLVNDLGQYDRSMGMVNRDLAVLHHAATSHAADLAQLLATLRPRPAPIPAPLDEIGRLVRTSWQHESQAFALHAHTQRLERRVHEIEGLRGAEFDRAEHHRLAHEQSQRDLAETTTALAAARAALEASDVRAATAEAALDAAQAAAESADTERHAALAESHRRGELLADFQSTLRYRLAQRLAAPVDRLRGRQ